VKPTHHPADDLLLAHASGTCGEAVSLLIATHLALCPACRRMTAAAEAIGGALLMDAPPVELGRDALTHVLSRLDDAPAVSVPPPTPVVTDGALPEPLRSYVGKNPDKLRWRRVTPGLWVYPLLERGPTRVKLIRSAPGAGISMHTHRGTELTLVLQGGFTDDDGHYLRGDVQTATPAITHRLVTDPDGYCLNLTVVDAPLKFVSPFVGTLAKLFGF
jgi:putative transcriptional regulator